MEDFKKHAETKSWEHFNHMQASVLESIAVHDNTLIVWALGNEGENCDNSSFWQELLGNETILQHSVLVYGQDSSLNRRVHRDSNYTNKHVDHALGKPFRTLVWDQASRRYVVDSGTSFSAPLATIDAFNVAQKILSSETGQAPLYSGVKSILVKK